MPWLTANSRKKIGEALLLLALVLMLGRFITQTHARMLTNSNSAEGDQLPFLQLGLDLREHGLITDGTRNPLYAVFLAPVAHRDWSYFTYAKLLSLTFGALAIIALYLLGRRFFNPVVGLAAAYLLSINTEFIVHSATALTEALLVLLFVLAWFAMLAALKQPARPGYWALAGGLAGLAYLAKGTGQLLALAFVATAIIIWRRELLKNKGWWLFLAGYALVASPLWLYNTIHFGSPTFNYATTHQMWMNNWNEWHPDDTADLPTAFTYLRDHTPAEIFGREWSGMQALRNILVKTLYPTRTLNVDRFLLSPISGITLAALALLPVVFWRASRRYLAKNGAAVCLTLLVTIIFFVLFSWYVSIVSLGQRFLLPIIPLIFVLLADIGVEVGQWLANRGIWPRRAVYLAVALAVAFQAQWAARTNVEAATQFATRSVFEQDRQFNADAAAPLVWLTAQAPPGRVVAWGPSGQSLPTWAFSDRLNFKNYPPQADSLAALTENLAQRRAEYIIVAPDMGSRYRSLVKELGAVNGSRLELAGIPPEWALAFAYHGMPCEWCIFRLRPVSPPQHAADFQIGPAITLTGYDLAPAQLHPGDVLQLTLHWAAQSPPGKDFTVFTQLQGPDWQLHGQLDHQPINNLWPTSRWQPGDHLADRYDIPLDGNAPAGPYRLLVGMYNAATGERQPVTQKNGAPVPDNAIFLDTITVTP